MTSKRLCKRLIEVDLPIKTISAQAQREKSIRHGHISTLHIWWARRPLAACRSVICASLWPAPTDDSCSNAFRHAAASSLQRLRDIRGGRTRDWSDATALQEGLLEFIADFSNWDNANDPNMLATAREITEAAARELGIEQAPLVFDPFAGGGAIPLEASRIGADAFASDLNPIPILLNEVALSLVPRFGTRLLDAYTELAEQVEDSAKDKLSRFYPRNRDGSTTIAWLWARTAVCEGPSCGCLYPLVGQTWVSQNRDGGEEIRLRVKGRRVESDIVRVKPGASQAVRTTKGSSAICPSCGFTMKSQLVQSQLSQRNGGADDAQLLAVVCRSADGREKFARGTTPADLKVHEDLRSMGKEIARRRPHEPFPVWDTRAFVPGIYGVTEWGYMHTPRQVMALSTFAECIEAAVKPVISKDPELGRAAHLLLGLTLGRLVDTSAATCRWVAGTAERGGSFIAAANGGEKHLRWITDFAESNPFSRETGSWNNHRGWIERVLENLCAATLRPGHVLQASALTHPLPDDSADMFVTDPPYGSAVPYGDLADFFYVWLRRALRSSYPELLREPLTPKREETVVNLRVPSDNRGEKTEESYHRGMTTALTRAREILKPTGIAVIVFADKRTSEWEAMLGAVLRAGWTITASWPIHTERPGRTRSLKSASLSSSVHLVCRPREDVVTGAASHVSGEWRDVLRVLPTRIAEWMPRLAQEGIVGADAIFACLGPALEVFSKYESVEKANGDSVELREYLEHVWAAVARQALSMVLEDAETTGLEPDGRLTAIWLWTLGGGASSSEQEIDEDGEEGEVSKRQPSAGFTLEYDAARKLAQGLGAHLEELSDLVEVSGETARLLPVSERARSLFAKGDAAGKTTTRKKKNSQTSLFADIESADESEAAAIIGSVKPAATTLDRVHQAMVLFGAGRGEALKRFLIEEGIGTQPQFWKLSQSLSALYPPGTDEKRWIDGVLARKKSFGFA